MGMGIMICGLNGVGKSTLGAALAEKLNLYLIDHERLYFPARDVTNPYAAPRTHEEVQKILLRELAGHKNFVFTAVKGNYDESICSLFQYVVLLHVPKEIRMQRVKNRSLQKFGERLLPGGDLQEQEERFFNFVQSRPEHLVEDWVRTLNCPVLRADGTVPIEDNVRKITKWIQSEPMH